MAGRIPEHTIRDIVRRADVVRLVNRYTRLREKGGKHWGLCPFHREKTPSFSVEPQEGLYYCFGCGEGGNIFTLLQKLEGLEFFEALQQLASDAGVDLTRFDRADESPRRKPETNALRRLNELASAFYIKCLEKARGSDIARDYLKNRKIDRESVDKWRIGYAPEGWDNLVRVARRRNLDLNMVERAGLIIPRRGTDSFYDRFRNRLIFPVNDRNGRVVGFGARALDDEQDAKYLNSPETPIFNKSSCFYGLDHARTAIRQSGTAVVVEGYTDVIMAHKYGFENVVAVLGTALTDSHAAMLGKLCERVILLFDPDTAGEQSAEKSIRTLLAGDMEPNVALLPSGLDPCDFLLRRGKEAFQQSLDESDDFLQFCLKKAGRDHDLGRRSVRSKLFQKLAETAAVVPNEVRREMLVREIAAELGVEPQSAFDYVARMQRRPRYEEGRPEDEGSGLQPPGAERKFLREMLTFLLVNPQYQKTVAGNKLFDRDLFDDTSERELLATLLEMAEEKGAVSESDFLYTLTDRETVSGIRAAVEKERKYATGDKKKRLQAYVDYLDRRRTRHRHAPNDNAMEDEETWLKAYVEVRRKEECK